MISGLLGNDAGVVVEVRSRFRRNDFGRLRMDREKSCEAERDSFHALVNLQLLYGVALAVAAGEAMGAGEPKFGKVTVGAFSAPGCDWKKGRT